MSLGVVPAREPSGARIRSIHPNREFAYLEVSGRLSDEGLAELRQRVDGLASAGARCVLVDLTDAGSVGPAMAAVITDAGRQLRRREGRLRVVGHDPRSAGLRYSASLPDLFGMYQAAVRANPDRAAGRRR